MKKAIFIMVVLLLTGPLPINSFAESETGINTGDLIAYESGKQAYDGDGESAETTEPEESEIAEEPYVARKEPITSFLLSLLVPGGGQFYNGQLVKGCVMLTAFAAGVGGSVELENEGEPGLAAAGLCLTAGIWAYSMADAIISSEKINAEHGFALVPTRDGIVVTYSYSF